MARRLSEAGVRFVEIRQPGWDHHTNLHNGLIEESAADRPANLCAADGPETAWSARRDTRPVRLRVRAPPTAQGVDGRDHNITGYSMFLTGAGVKKGFSYGQHDEIGMEASKVACTLTICTQPCWR